MDLKLDLIGWSFGAGTIAFFNPCGFAMLPAYVAHYLGRGDQAHSGQLGLVLKGLTLGGVVSGGFFIVFVALGLAISFIGRVFGLYLPWTAAAIGLALMLLGIAMLIGNFSVSLPIFIRISDKLFRPNRNSEEDAKGLAFYYSYGIAYGVASVGCTFPIFMIVVGNAFAGGFLHGSAQFGAYAFGMSVMMLVLSVIMVFSKTIIAKIIPRVMRTVQLLGSLGVIAAGGYLIYYNLILTEIIMF